MKRAIAIVLTLALVICLTACIQSDKPAGTDPTGTTPVQTTPTDPTDPEPTIAERLQIYLEIWAQLEQYASRDYETFSFSGLFVSGGGRGNEGLAYCYDYLQSMDDLKPYLNEESWNSQVPDYLLPSQSPEQLLRRFTIVEDVLLGMKYSETTVDWGLQHYDQQVIWRYDTKGNLVHLDQRNWSLINDYQMPQHRFYSTLIHGDTFFEYDEAGNLKATWFGDRDELRLKLIPTYDDTGRLIQEDSGKYVLRYSYDDHGQWSNVEYSRPFTYDESGNITSYSVQRWSFTHVYDDDRKVIQTTETKYHDDQLQYTIVTNYEYDSEGRICKETNGSSTVTYTYDEKDRVLTKTEEFGPKHYPLSYTETYIYGDQYVFDEYVVNFTEENLT